MPTEDETEIPFAKRYASLRSSGHILYICGTVNAELLLHVQRTIAEMGPAEDGTIVVLDTPGGQTYAALSIYQELRLLAATQDIVILARTRVHSAGVLLLMAVPVERRFALSPTTFLLHPSAIKETVTVDGTIERLEEELRVREIDARDMRTRNDLINEIIAAGTGQPLEEVTRLDEAAEYIDEQRAMSLRLISRVITV